MKQQNDVWLINLNPTIGMISQEISDEIKMGLAKVLSIKTDSD